MIKIDKERALYIFKKEYENTIFILSQGEGSLMTFSETVATIAGGMVKARPRDIILVKNIQNTVDFIIDQIYINSFYFDKDMLCYINRLVASDDNFDNLGGFRKNNIRIQGSKNTGVKPSELEFRFYEILNDYIGKDSNGILELKLCLDLAKSQFFGDGNKRTAQLMMNGLLVSNGYAPVVVNFRDNHVVDALIKYYNEGDMTDILKIMLCKQKEIMLSYSNEKDLLLINKEYENDILNISQEIKY